MANVRGLNDLKEDAEEEKRQAYYAGGQGQNGGGSGQEILDPREFMRRARDELGARSIDEYNAEQQQQAFTGVGTGRSLNAPPPPPAEEEAEPAAASDSAPVAATTHTITFWRDGFTVDDGPLRRTDDPENAQFLADINRGQVPRELEASSNGACPRSPVRAPAPGARQQPTRPRPPRGCARRAAGADIDVHCIDKSTEAYTPPPPTVKPFTGAGHSMRDDSAPADAVGPVTPQEAVVDDSQPTTSVQLRLHDGSRRVLKLNHSHTVAQLRAHVATLVPPGARFELSTQFPRTKLAAADDAKTIADAGLLNNTVVASML